MIGTPNTGTLSTAIISGVGHEGLKITTADGKPAQLAIVDENGQIITAGPEVAREAWAVAIAVYKNFLAGKGYLRVFSQPSCQGPGSQAAA